MSRACARAIWEDRSADTNFRGHFDLVIICAWLLVIYCCFIVSDEIVAVLGFHWSRIAVITISWSVGSFPSPRYPRLQTWRPINYYTKLHLHIYRYWYDIVVSYLRNWNWRDLSTLLMLSPQRTQFLHSSLAILTQMPTNKP